jgi:tetratricopeptide (TPR) repeat protein
MESKSLNNGRVELAQNAILRLTIDNFSQIKSRERLIKEHKKLENYCDMNEYVVHNINRQENLTLNIQHRITISNLQVDNTPTGRFLLCRVISRFVKINALLTLVEDPEGNVERLALYNWISIPKEGQPNCKTIDQFFLPVGTLLVIKNMSYKVATSNITIIRSENPDDVTIVDYNNKLFNDIKWSTNLNENEVEIKNVDDFRRCGNNYFASNNYNAAIDEYSNGLELEPQNVTLLSNRAEAFLRLCQFHNALKDVEIALKYDPNNLKAAYRKGKALCGLKHYKEATDTLQDLCQRIKGNNSIKQSTNQLLKHAEMLTFENKNGQYDYLRIIDDFIERVRIKKDSNGIYEAGPRLEHADFLNNDIEIGLVEGKGRGWIAKCDIPEHTLLMVSKAFKVVFSDEIVGSYSDTEELASCITQKLLAEPYYCQEVYQLYDGLNLNLNEKNEKINKKIVSVDIIEGVTKHNCFGPVYEKFNLETKLTGAGVWILPSFFNHSCIDENVYHFFIGDLIFFRSNRPISKGEELIINYRNVAFSYEERSRYLKSINIDCQCRMCKLERFESQEIKLRMTQLLKTYKESIKPKIKNFHNVDSFLIKELEDIIAELRNLRKEHSDLGIDTIKLSNYLAHAYHKNGDTKKGLSILKKTYDLYKTIRLSRTMIIIISIIIFNIELGLFKEAKKWFDMILKLVTEPIIGKLEENKPEQRKEALRLMEIMIPDMKGLIKFLESA